MSQIHEFRVRPVNRFIVTEYRRDDSPGQASGGTPRTIAEMPNEDLANELGRLLQRSYPGSTLVNSEGERVPGHTSYPSRYAIGARVMRCELRISQDGIGQRGILHLFGAEEAEVVGVHFYPGKVCYDVVFPSGRHGETVDSVELTDLPLDPLSTTVP